MNELDFSRFQVAFGQAGKNRLTSNTSYYNNGSNGPQNGNKWVVCNRRTNFETLYVLILNLLTYQKSTKVGNTGSYLETNLSQSLLASMKQDNPIESATNQ